MTVLSTSEAKRQEALTLGAAHFIVTKKEEEMKVGRGRRQAMARNAECCAAQGWQSGAREIGMGGLTAQATATAT